MARRRRSCGVSPSFAADEDTTGLLFTLNNVSQIPVFPHRSGLGDHSIAPRDEELEGSSSSHFLCIEFTLDRPLADGFSELDVTKEGIFVMSK